MIVARRLINTRGWQYERARARARTHLQPLSMKSILYCIADQDRVRLFMIRGTLPGIVYTLGLQARTRVTRLIFVPPLCHLKKRTFNFCLWVYFGFRPFIFFFLFFFCKRDDCRRSICFWIFCLIKRRWFFFMKFGIFMKYIEQSKLNLKRQKMKKYKDTYLNYVFFLCKIV